MFNQNIDDRLSSWAQHRTHLNQCETPFQDTWEFWKSAPYIPYNNKIDPYHQQSWPSPWEIIVGNQYDDFTKSLMIGWSLLLTTRFKSSNIVIKTLIDKKNKNIGYNIVCIDDTWAINFNDNGPVLVSEIPDDLILENIIDMPLPN